MKEKGFTLIELLIVIVVIAILAAIAYPSYQESVRKSRRADAQGVMMELAQWMERYYTENNRYSLNADGTGDPPFPGILAESPKEGDNKYYGIQLNALAAGSYTIVAAPKNAQSGDKCGSFTLTSTGVQDITGQDTGVVKEDCWRK
jgi:type IV pilus assembly protein PilE